jgi:jumonji domain-containing protein 7
MLPPDPIADLITTYHEFNATAIDELHEEPSALEFMRYVAKNRPFVVRGGAKSWKACEAWDATYLSEVMRSEEVQVAVTPYGYVALWFLDNISSAWRVLSDRVWSLAYS